MAHELLNQLLADIKESMKAREAEKLTALRSLHAQIKDAGTNAGREENDELVTGVVAKALKQRQDAAEQFRAGKRPELAEKEEREAGWIRKYQLQQFGEVEIEQIVRAAITETGASGKGDMGKVMKAAMPKLKGRADGKLVNQIVARLLG